MRSAYRGSVDIRDEARRPRHTGNEINLRFLKEGFSNLIVRFDVNPDHTVRVRTRTSILYFVRVADGKWKLYSYRDEPMEDAGEKVRVLYSVFQ